jgi:hypothetical protein
MYPKVSWIARANMPVEVPATSMWKVWDFQLPTSNCQFSGDQPMFQPAIAN